MSTSSLPERASLEFLKKLAKERLRAMRRDDPAARLADAQLAIAREHGFADWRALKAEVDHRRAPRLAAFFQACAAGDASKLRALLVEDRALARERDADGSAGLHLAAPHAAAVRELLAAGADPDARDEGDHATALHFAAAQGALDSVRALLDAGADVHGAGDLHQGGVIGWAARPGNEVVVALLLAHGARHHIFSAMALGDVALVERLVEDDPACLSRRRSRFENRQTPLHAALAPPEGHAGRAQHALLARLIDLGADVDAVDDRGRTPLQLAMLRGDDEAMRLLQAAGARMPPAATDGMAMPSIAHAADAVTHAEVMFAVADLRATLRWYEALGFTVAFRHDERGEPIFARLALGRATFALGPGGEGATRDARLWFFVERIEPLHAAVSALQLTAARAAMAGAENSAATVRFDEDLYEPFYGGRQFSIRDPDGIVLVFYQPPPR